MKNVLAIITLSILIVQQCWGQIGIENSRSISLNSKQGFYINDHFAAVYQSEVPDRQKIEALLREDSLDMGSKTYRFATATKINVDFVASAHWVTRGAMTYGRLLIVAPAAKSLSLNFSAFAIPDFGELTIYNASGTIAGPITSKENNDSQTWASPVFNGDSIWIEAKPADNKERSS